MDTKNVVLKLFAEAKLTYLKAIKTIIFIQLKTLTVTTSNGHEIKQIQTGLFVAVELCGLLYSET